MTADSRKGAHTPGQKVHEQALAAIAKAEGRA